jgi:protocatechuate 3,4-dioxygenase alpha subunit
MVTPQTAGEHIRIQGRIFDGDGQPVNPALIEIWQANAQGRYAHSADTRTEIKQDKTFTGFGRAVTDAEGRFVFDTVKPGAVPGPGNALQAPHINVTIFARGMDVHLFTRLYFIDEDEANGIDPVLNSVVQTRRSTLIATRSQNGGRITYDFEIRMRGENETVFFDA